MFSHPGLYTPWAVQPLSVASSPDRFAKCEMSASLLSNDQVRHACLLLLLLEPIMLNQCLHTALSENILYDDNHAQCQWQ